MDNLTVFYNYKTSHQLNTIVVSLLSHVQLFATPWTVAHQGPPSIGFLRQEYWSGLPSPPQGVFLTQGSNPYFLCLLHWQGGFFSTMPPAKSNKYYVLCA